MQTGEPLSRDEGRIPSSPFHTAARALLVATICGAPWAFGAVQPWAWASLMVLSLLALVLWAAGCAHHRLVRIHWSPLFWPFLAFLVLAVVQLFAGLSVDHVATREAVLKIFTNLVFFFLAGQLLSPAPENGKASQGFGLVVVLLAFALCFLGLAQMWSSGEERIIYWTFLVSGKPFGPYVNHNNYAGLMEMLLPISVVYIFSRVTDRLARVAMWCGVILVIVSIWIGGSRGATLVLLIEGVLLAGILMWREPRGFSPRYLVVMLVAVLISIAGFSWLVRTGRVVGRAWSVFETQQSLGVKLGDRLGVGVDTSHMVRSHPWAGVGLGCFEYVFPNYLTFPTDLHWIHAHDDVLEAAAETGLPGVVLMLAAVVLFLRSAFRHLDRRLRHGWGWIQFGAAVSTVGLFCHSFVDFNLRVPANAAWFVVCLAIATHARSAPEDSRKRMVWNSGPERSSEFLT